MIYLCEREIGFDAKKIGFPSVRGCRAIVLVTGSGLFGFHLNGTLSAAKKAALVNFVAGHARGGSQKMALYAASEGGVLQGHRDELRDLAAALGHTGPVYWAGLPTGNSSFVHALDVGHATCGITARPWNDAADSVPANKAAYAPSNDRTMANGAATAQMYVNVDTAGLRAVYPIKI